MNRAEGRVAESVNYHVNSTKGSKDLTDMPTSIETPQLGNRTTGAYQEMSKTVMSKGRLESLTIPSTRNGLRGLL